MVTSASLVAAHMQASLCEKTEKIKFKAKDQALKLILTSQVLHKQPSVRQLNVFLKRWKERASDIAVRAHQKDWQNEQISTVLKEKQELEKKVND